MKNKISYILIILAIFILSAPVQAETIIDNDEKSAIILETTDTREEEIQGKEVWEKLQSHEFECANLSEEQFEVLGEYFMGQMLGEAHKKMNKIIIENMSKDGENQTHVGLGKRLSGCDYSDEIIKQGFSFMPILMGQTTQPEEVLLEKIKAKDKLKTLCSPQQTESSTNFPLMSLLNRGWLFILPILSTLLLAIIGLLAIINWVINSLKGKK